MSLARGNQVAGMVFHVEAGGRRWLVWEERNAAGDLELACTCPLRHGCEHVTAVLAHLEQYVPAGAAGQAEREPGARVTPSGPGSMPSEASWVSSGMTIPPPPPGEDGAPMLHGDLARTAAVRTAIALLVEAAAVHGLGPGREALRPCVEGLIRAMGGLSARDTLRVAADLIGLAQGPGPDPARVAAVLEEVRAVLDVMDAHMAGADPGAKLEGAYLGRTWAFEDSKREEEVDLIEIARAAAGTPFGTRRGAAWYLDAQSGDAYVEHSLMLHGDRPRQQPGPFPRRIHANLMIVVPGIHPRPIRMLQCSILRPPREEAILKVRKMSLTSAREVMGLFRRIAATAHAPYPAFVTFAPAGMRVQGEAVALEDGEGDLLPLDHGSSIDACRALGRIAADGKVHCVSGLVSWTGREIALDPLSVLIETQRGFSLARLR